MNEEHTIFPKTTRQRIIADIIESDKDDGGAGMSMSLFTSFLISPSILSVYYYNYMLFLCQYGKKKKKK